MKALAIVLSILAYFSFFQIYPNYVNGNESSRFLLTAALVENHTFKIDEAMKRYGDTQDKSLYQGHFYSAKPIGYSLIAVPFYFVIHAFTHEKDIALNIWYLRFFLNFIPLVLFCIYFFRYLERKLQLGHKAYVPLLALLFGTLFYPFTQLFMSHVLTGILWFVAFVWVTEENDRKYGLAAGALLGFTFLMEMLTVIPIGFTGLYLLIRKRSLVIPFILGVAIFSSPAFLTNWYLYGGPLNWIYKYTVEADFKANNTQGYVGVLLPNPSVIWKLTLGSNRGLFFYMPHLVFGAAGLMLEKEKRADAILALAIIAGNVLFVSSMLAWDGGWCFGPRYLIPVIPFLIYGVALGLRRFNEKQIMHVSILATYLILLAVTIPLMLFATASWPFSPRFLPNPILWENFTMFWRGFYGLNLGRLLGAGDRWIRLFAISMVVIPSALFFFWSQLPRKFALLFVLIMFLFFPLSRRLVRPIENRTSADHCYIIGLAGYIQGNYEKSVPYFHRTLQRNPGPKLENNARFFLWLIRTGKAGSQLVPGR